MRLLRILSAAGLPRGTVTHRTESGGPGVFNHSQPIGNAIFAKDRCETLVEVSRIPSHPQTKTPAPFYSFIGNATFVKDLCKVLKGDLDGTVGPTRKVDGAGELWLQQA